MHRVTRCVLFVVVGGVAMLGLTVAPSDAGSTTSATGTHQVSQDRSGAARVAKRHKRHHHKKKHRRRHRRHATPRSSAATCWPGTPSLGAARLAGAIQFRWGTTACTTRYRLHLSPAWYGEWPGTPWYTPWTGSTARSQTWRLPSYPHAHDGMMAVAYANPIFARLEANNGAHAGRTATHVSRWVPQWAKAPAPKAGDPVRFGSYNVMLYPTGTRAGVVARNIGGHGLTMVALQEARQTTASTVVSYLNKLYPGTWDYVRASGATVSTPGQQIVYRKDKFSLSRSGVMNLWNYKDKAHRVIAPWAAFRANRGGSYGKTFYVTSQHFSGTAHSSLAQNGITGQAAALVIKYMKGLTSGPVIVAGDLRYGREPWGERAGYVPAQPTFVRNGYYDAMASQSMHAPNYSIVNVVGGRASARQRPNPSGLGARSDYILMRGITGSKQYVNVINWSFNRMVPSDHNLIYSDIAIPY